MKSFKLETIAKPEKIELCFYHFRIRSNIKTDFYGKLLRIYFGILAWYWISIYEI